MAAKGNPKGGAASAAPPPAYQMHNVRFIRLSTIVQQEMRGKWERAKGRNPYEKDTYDPVVACALHFSGNLFIAGAGKHDPRSMVCIICMYSIPQYGVCISSSKAKI